MIILNFSNSIILKNCCKFIIVAINRHFQIEQINCCVTNAQAFMHLNTHFIEFELLNHNNVKPFGKHVVNIVRNRVLNCIF